MLSFRSATALLLVATQPMHSSDAFAGVSSTTVSKTSNTAVFAQQSNMGDFVEDNISKNSVDRASRRSFITASTAAAFAALVMGAPEQADAAADCFADCLKSCKLIAPKDPSYCQSNCKDYCDQDDRTDGLSGSVSSSGGETGILGRNTVVKGEDKPPDVKIPGLDFSSDKGRKLLGY